MSTKNKARRSFPRSWAFARENGWRVEQTGGDDLRWHKPGRPFVVSALTPSDVRADLNNLSRLRAAERGRS